MGGRAGGRLSRGPRGALEAVAATALAVALVGGFLAVDTRAEASFDAPKRLVELVGIAVAAAALLAARGPVLDRSWTRLSRPARLAAAMVGVFLVLATLSAALSPRPEPALDGLRVLVLSALLLPLGASRASSDGRGRAVLAAFIAAAVVSSGMAVGQTAGWWRGLALESVAGRSAAVALVGNEGVLALALVLAAVAAVAALLHPVARRLRVAAVLAQAMLLAGILSVGNLTGILALTFGLLTVAVLRWPRRSVLASLILLVGAALAATAPPVSARLAQIAVELRAGGLDAAASGRVAAWAAAAEMVRERPLTGFGPATFAAEYAPHRVAAELRLGRRLAPSTTASHHGEAHCEILQAAAELGLPAAAAALGAVVALAWAVRRALAHGTPRGAEVVVLAAVLVTGCVASLLWFPLQRPVTSVPLLLAAGRLWRLTGDGS